MFSDLVQPYVNYVPPLLEAGVRVLIYAGDADYICNWIGNKAWITALEWSGTPAFLQIFLKDYPKYSKSNFTVTGESYAGHYIPAIAHAIQESNLIVSQSNPKNLMTVNLESIAIGNGVNGSSVLVTQCQPTQCRRIFPCFDQPNRKASQNSPSFDRSWEYPKENLGLGFYSYGGHISNF